MVLSNPCSSSSLRSCSASCGRLCDQTRQAGTVIMPVLGVCIAYLSMKIMNISLARNRDEAAVEGEH